ncbi:MAG: M56 family metallopeptidase [Vicingaceae bacterium]|nr:M56 family metallopeptidase [Vicingaceae bacterium]
MEQLIYIGKIGGLFTLLYLIYFLFFKNSTFFQVNRFYLLLIIPFSFIIPLINWSETITNYYTISLPTIKLSSSLNASTSYSYMDVISTGYIAISAFFAIKLLYNLTTIIIRINHIKRGKEINIAPFSFFNFIHIPKELDEESKKEIITHERVHSTQLHSIDVLTYELLKIILWWNPFVWLASYSVKCNHEFIADNIASKNSKENYSSVLIAQLLGVNCSMLANNFNYKPLIKRRIMMMKTTKTKSLSMLKYALVIPVAIIFATVSINQKAVANTTEVSTNQVDAKDNVEVMPEFKGGMDAMIKYMSENINYPKETGLSGVAYIAFIVDEKGNVTDAAVAKSAAEPLDKEALRVVKAMPKWTPGKDKGKNVKVKMTLPVSFKMQ